MVDVGRARDCLATTPGASDGTGAGVWVSATYVQHDYVALPPTRRHLRFSAQRLDGPSRQRSDHAATSNDPARTSIV